jgi:hypothetical protein
MATLPTPCKNKDQPWSNAGGKIQVKVGAENEPPVFGKIGRAGVTYILYDKHYPSLRA